MKQFSKLLALFTSLLIFTFYSCEKDLYENQIQNEQNNISMQKVRLQDIEKAMSEKINQKIISIKEQKKKSINEQGKFEYNSSLDIYIDTENGRLINHNGKISYTFPMFRENENKLENIVFGVENNSIYGIEIFSYDLTDLELNHLKNGDYVDVSNKTVIELIESSRFSGDSFPCTLIVSEQASEGFVYTYGVFVRCGYPGASCPPGACDSGGGGGEGENQNDSNTGNNTTGYTPSGYIPTGGNPNGGVGNFPTGDSINIYHQPGGNQGTGNPNTTGGVYGNGGLDGTGITTTPVVSSTLTIKQIKQNFLTTANLNQQQLDWWNSNTNSATVTLLSTYLFNNQIIDVDMPNQYEFAVWAINYNISHPATTPEKFSNWFMTPREGIDGNYDQSYWEDPNLNFQSQSLPTFADFDAAYPRQSGTVLIGIIGGDVEQAYINNPNNVRGFCALKVSKGLNDSGVTIPNIPGKTIKGGDNNYYFLNAKALNVWMRKTFGVSPTNSSHIRITNSQAGVNGENLPTLTANIKGIYSLVSSNPNWASGHADLLNANGTCIFGCHFSDAPIDFIDIWILN
jgi:hypothetical protein